jgi:hypothetical protein
LGFLHQQNEFAMLRLMLTDKFWSKLEKILFPETIDNKRNLRMTRNTVSNADWLSVA